MPPILFYWPMILEVNVGGMSAEVEFSHQYSITFCCQGTDGSRGAVWHGSAYKQRGVIKYFHEEKKALVDIHWCLLNIYGDQRVDVSSQRRCFNSGNSDMKDKPRSGWPCRLLWAQHAGFCALLEKMYSKWWWLCWRIVFGSWEFAWSNNVLVLFLSVVVSFINKGNK